MNDQMRFRSGEVAVLRNLLAGDWLGLSSHRPASPLFTKLSAAGWLEQEAEVEPDEVLVSYRLSAEGREAVKRILG